MLNAGSSAMPGNGLLKTKGLELMTALQID